MAHERKKNLSIIRSKAKEKEEKENSRNFNYNQSFIIVQISPILFHLSLSPIYYRLDE